MLTILLVKRVISTLFMVYTLLLLARILGSWFPQWHDHPVMRFICRYTDPYLNLFRRFIPPLGVIDLSPVVAFFALQIVEWLILSLFK
jgi:YggT family protein